MSVSHSPWSPRNGVALRVLIIARISTVHQDLRSLADQIALCEKFVRERHSGEVTFVHIQGQGSGEYLDRKELAEAEAAVESGIYDGVVMEDIGRFCRRNRAVYFCEQCEDMKTRLVAINDSIDTAEENWRFNAFFAAFKHESGNKDTAKRIRRSLRNRFELGGVVQTFPYGYVKPAGAKSDADIRKDPSAERVYEAWFRMLESGASYSEVADWLNSEKIKLGPWTRSVRWTCRMVGRITHNPILKGYRRRNERMSQRVNKTGRPRSIKAPPCELLVRHVPHLQFIEPGRYDRLISQLDANNAHYARGRKAGRPDARVGVPKKRTVWPGQHLVCGICGRLFYWGGHGQRSHMMCAGAREYDCWNGSTFDGGLAGERITAAITTAIEQLPEFDREFLDRVRTQSQAGQEDRADELRQVDRDLGEIGRGLQNILAAIEKVGFSDPLQGRLMDLEGRRVDLLARQVDLHQRPNPPGFFLSTDELKRAARIAFEGLAAENPEFGRLMHRLVPQLVVLPYRLVDGGRTVLRAHLTLDLVSFVPGWHSAEMSGLIRHDLVVDLFLPPQRVALREKAVELLASGLTERKVADQLGITQPAVQNAKALDSQMRHLGLSDPYRPVTEPLEGESKLRRHLHSRYRFNPLPGWPR